MQIIHYGQSHLRTADEVATALLDYAEALSTSRSYAVAEVPTSAAQGIGVVALLLGPGISLTCVTDASATEGSARGPDALLRPAIEASVRRLTTAAEAVRGRAFASALPVDDEVLDALERLLLDDDASLQARGTAGTGSSVPG